METRLQSAFPSKISDVYVVHVRPACPDLNLRNTQDPASNHPLRHQSPRRQKLRFTPLQSGPVEKIENTTGLSVQNDKTSFYPQKFVGINAPCWRRSHVGPLFSDKHSRSCSRTRFCSTLDFLLLQLSIGSNYTEATVRSKTVKEKRSCMISCALGWAQNA